jgi:arylsulfatase A-like enzyme
MKDNKIAKNKTLNQRLIIKCLFVMIILMLLLLIIFIINLLFAKYNNNYDTQNLISEKETNYSNYNFLLIVVDALRHDHLGCYGYEKNTSPNIDSICERGIVFENAIAQATWTKPSMVSLFVSNYVKDHNITFFTDDYKKENVGNILPASAVTLAETLSDKGYNTKGIVGNPVIKKGFGLEQGFGEYDYFFNDDKSITFEALDWINENKEGKFFLYLHYMAPHADYNPPREYKEKFKDYYEGDIEFEGKHQDYFNNMTISKEDLEELIARYDGEINYADNEIGKIIGHLKKENIFNKTILVITSDHGEALGERGLIGHGHLLNTVIQVPLIIYLPKQEHKKVKGIVELIDVSPSILFKLKVDVPVFFKGVDTLQSQNENDLREFGFSQYGPYLGVRSKRYFFKNVISDKFLYDLEFDPYEFENIKEWYPEIFKKFLDASSCFNSKRGEQEFSIKDIDKKTLEELKSLGYI